MTQFRMTPEEHGKAVLAAMEEIHKKHMESKEEALAFLERAGIILEDKPKEPKNRSKTKKSK
jgi:hypothetical protein